MKIEPTWSITVTHYDLQKTPIMRLRRILAWADWQRESWWLPSGRPDPTIEQIIKTHELVVDVLGLDTIEAAFEMTAEDIVNPWSYTTLVSDSKGDRAVIDEAKREVALTVIRAAQAELYQLLSIAPRDSIVDNETQSSEE